MWRQLKSELSTFPSLKRWLIYLLGTVLLLAAAFVLLPTFSDLSAIPDFKTIAIIALVGFFTPALFEELTFRFLINFPQKLWTMISSTLLFVAWHPFEAYVFLPTAKPYFLDPGFLIFVGIYGAYSCWLRFHSKSLWPSIITHWMVVITWKGLGGAQFLT